jgi:OHCU decarboxylase
MIGLAEVNAMDEAAFVATFGALYEHAPRLAAAAWRARPFATRAELHAAFAAALGAAPPEEQLALLRAHPELAGREAAAGELTADSAREQGAAGLDRLAPGELEALQELNAAYRERFGFPLIVCVREHSKDSILAWGRARLTRAADDERETALGEVAKIARLRLREVVA